MNIIYTISLLETWRYLCQDCRKEFPENSLPGDFLYGEFLMRSNENIVYLNAITDPVYDEVWLLIKNNNITKNKNEDDQSEILKNVFSVVCDPDIDGSLFQITLKPRCPHCGSRNTGKWLPYQPAKYVEKDIPHVTHKKWNSLNKDQKISLVDSAIKQFVKINKARAD